MKNNMDNKKIVLIAEDEKSLRGALHSKLLTEGFDVLEAKDGEEGLEKSLKEHPNIILLDLLMPKMDGMTMLSKLRADDWGKNVPVIILTNLSGADEKRNREITKLEPTYYFMKSEKPIMEVVEKIKEKLGII
jgi:DNA-binding response OmpR family regulator